MPITYTVDRDRELITEIWTGDVHDVDLESYWKQYLQDPEVLRIRRTLVDLRKAVIHFNGYELSVLIGNIVFPVVYDKRLKWKTAIVVADSSQFKASRQYQALAQHYSEDAIFETIEQASSWLCKSESSKS